MLTLVDISQLPNIALNPQGIEVGRVTAGQEPLEVTVTSSADQLTEGSDTPTLVVTVTFQGHYNEPPVALHCPVGGKRVFDLSYDVSGTQGGWTISNRTE